MEKSRIWNYLLLTDLLFRNSLIRIKKYPKTIFRGWVVKCQETGAEGPVSGLLVYGLSAWRPQVYGSKAVYWFTVWG